MLYVNGKKSQWESFCRIICPLRYFFLQTCLWVWIQISIKLTVEGQFGFQMIDKIVTYRKLFWLEILYVDIWNLYRSKMPRDLFWRYMLDKIVYRSSGNVLAVDFFNQKNLNFIFDLNFWWTHITKTTSWNLEVLAIWGNQLMKLSQLLSLLY